MANTDDSHNHPISAQYADQYAAQYSPQTDLCVEVIPAPPGEMDRISSQLGSSCALVVDGDGRPVRVIPWDIERGAVSIDDVPPEGWIG